MAGFETWEAALAEPLYLFFEANLSPGAYLGWLRHHLGERTLIPYVSEAATVAGARLEGATKVDAMLLAPRTDVAIVFEAMVLSDVSTSVTFDASRNQLARTIWPMRTLTHWGRAELEPCSACFGRTRSCTRRWPAKPAVRSQAPPQAQPATAQPS